MLGAKYGKEYMAEASSDTFCSKWHVNQNLVRWVPVLRPIPVQSLSNLVRWVPVLSPIPVQSLSNLVRWVPVLRPIPVQSLSNPALT